MLLHLSYINDWILLHLYTADSHSRKLYATKDAKIEKSQVPSGAKGITLGADEGVIHAMGWVRKVAVTLVE